MSLKTRLEAAARAGRSLIQGAFAAGAVAAVTAAQSALGDGAFQLRIVAIAVVTAFTTAAVSYVYTVVAPYVGASTPALESVVRASRTLLAGAVSTGLIAAGDAIYAAVQGGTFAPWVVGSAAVSAATTAIVAFVHNAIKPRQAAA